MEIGSNQECGYRYLATECQKERTIGMCETYNDDDRFMSVEAAAKCFDVKDLDEFYRDVKSSGYLIRIAGIELVDTVKFQDWVHEEARRLAARTADEPSDKGDAVRTHRT